MSDQDINKAITAIQKINQKFIVRYGHSNPPILSYTIAGSYFFISMLIDSEELKLFNSEDDDRSFNENTNSYEPWLKYLKNKFDYKRETINRIKM